MRSDGDSLAGYPGGTSYLLVVLDLKHRVSGWQSTGERQAWANLLKMTDLADRP